MAYGYYADPGNTFGNTGETTQQKQETYIERQQRLQAAAAPKPATTTSSTSTATAANGGFTAPTGSTGTPVSGSGKIPEPVPAAPAAPAPAPAPAKTQEQLEKEAGIIDAQAQWNYGPGSEIFKGFVMINGKMFSRDSPEYKAAIGSVSTAAPAAAPAAALVGAPGSAQGGAAEASKGVFTQYAAPEHDFQNWQQLQMVSNLLANPQTMNAGVVEQLKQKSMEEALLFKQQRDAQLAEELAARGMSSYGGAASAGRRKTADAIESAILGQNRDIDIQAAQQNRQDELQALGIAESILGGQVGRSGNVFQNILAGQQANRDDLFRGKQLDLQKELGIGGLNIDQQRVANQNRQFDAGHGLNILQFLEGQRQFNGNLGFNYNQLSANQQSGMMNSILNSLVR
jgi:hypothetical protein